MTAIHDGRPQWTPTDHLLADIWVMIARVNAEKGALPEDFDHPARVEMKALALVRHKQELKREFEQRKRAYANP